MNRNASPAAEVVGGTVLAALVSAVVVTEMLVDGTLVEAAVVGAVLVDAVLAGAVLVGAVLVGAVVVDGEAMADTDVVADVNEGAAVPPEHPDALTRPAAASNASRALVNLRPIASLGERPIRHLLTIRPAQTGAVHTGAAQTGSSRTG